MYEVTVIAPTLLSFKESMPNIRLKRRMTLLQALEDILDNSLSGTSGAKSGCMRIIWMVAADVRSL